MENSAAKSGNANSALVICPHTEMLSEFAPVLGHNLPGVQVRAHKEYPSGEALSVLLSGERIHLCFLDVVSSTEKAMQVIAGLQIVDASIQTIVLLDGNSPDLILRCLRAGATEFLIRPFNPEDLKPVLQRLSQLTPSISYGRGGRIICLAPTKGACGASTLAAALAFQKKKLGANRLLLVDFDATTGTISFLLKLKSNYSILDALSRAAALDEDLWKGIISPVDGVDVLPAPENPTETLHELPDPTPVLEFARQLYDVTIVDCAGVATDWGLALARASDEFLLVTTNELPALQATQRALTHLDRNRIERSKVRLVVNRYSREVGLSREAIATALHSDVFEVIPSDYEAVQRGIVEGRPALSGSTFLKSTAALAERLNPSAQSSSPSGKPKSNSLGGLFSSIFSKATP
jgi:pilus assembly protein CpaE